MEVHAIGIDLGKTVFHLVGLDSSGNVIGRKRCSRTQRLKYTANLQVQRIGMEACLDLIFSHVLCTNRATTPVDPGAVSKTLREDQQE